jgi:hypothetical protein
MLSLHETSVSFTVYFFCKFCNKNLCHFSLILFETWLFFFDTIGTVALRF